MKKFALPLLCLIITLPSYLNASDDQKNTQLVWTCSLKRTTEKISQPWLQILLDYTKAAKQFSNETDQDLDNLFKQFQLIADKYHFTLSNEAETTSNLHNLIIRLLGKKVASCIDQCSNNPDIHGELKLSLSGESMEDLHEIQCTLELSCNETLKGESFNTLKETLNSLVNELNTASIQDTSNPDYGILLHGVAVTAKKTQAFTCTAELIEIH